MPPNSRLTIVVPKSQGNSANTWMQANVDAAGGLETFTSLYVKPDNSQYYVASGLWTEEQCNDLEAKYGTKAYEGNPQEILASLSLTPFSPGA